MGVHLDDMRGYSERRRLALCRGVNRGRGREARGFGGCWRGFRGSGGNGRFIIRWAGVGGGRAGWIFGVGG